MHFEQPPFTRNASKLVGTKVRELDSRSGHEILDRRRDQQRARSRPSRDPGAHMHGNATDPSLEDLALARVHARPNGHSQSANSVDDLARTGHRPGRTVEGGEEAVSCGVDLATSGALKRATNDRVVLRQQFPPGPVAQCGGTLRGTDDVREQHRADLAHQRLVMNAVTLEKPLVQRLGCWPRGGAEFFAQEAARNCSYVKSASATLPCTASTSIK